MPFEEGKSGNPGGRPKDKPFADALRMAIKEAGPDHKALRAVAVALLEKAQSGDVPAINALADRLDGKVPQAVDATHQHEAGDTLTEFMRQMWKTGEGSIMTLADDGNDQ